MTRWYNTHAQLKTKEVRDGCHILKWRPIWKGTVYLYFDKSIFRMKNIFEKYRTSGPNSADVIKIQLFGFYFWVQYNLVSFRNKEKIGET